MQKNVADAFTARLSTDPVFRTLINQSIARAALAAPPVGFDPIGPMAMKKQNPDDDGPPPDGVPGGGEPMAPPEDEPRPYAEGYWWGFHVVMTHSWTQWVCFNSNVGTTIASALADLTGPAAVFIDAIVTVVQLETAAIQACDVGNGTYLSMLWVAPGVFVPTSR